MLRDQSEDRPQSDNIVFAKETPAGLRWGVQGRDGENPVMNPDPADAFIRDYERRYPTA